MDNPNLYEKGTIFVAPGGGGAPTPLTPGADGTQLIRDDNADLGVAWSSSVPGEGDVSGPGVAVNNNFAAFDGTTGKLIKDSGSSSASFRPAPVTGGGAATKGSFTLTAGTHAQIATTAAVTGCVIVYSIVTLGTVSAPQAILSTIDDGVGFTPVSADNTDTSVVNWAIVAEGLFSIIPRNSSEWSSSYMGLFS